MLRAREVELGFYHSAINWRMLNTACVNCIPALVPLLTFGWFTLVRRLPLISYQHRHMLSVSSSRGPRICTSMSAC